MWVLIITDLKWLSIQITNDEGKLYKPLSLLLFLSKSTPQPSLSLWFSESIIMVIANGTVWTGWFCTNLSLIMIMFIQSTMIITWGKWNDFANLTFHTTHSSKQGPWPDLVLHGHQQVEPSYLVFVSHVLLTVGQHGRQWVCRRCWLWCWSARKCPYLSHGRDLF